MNSSNSAQPNPQHFVNNSSLSKRSLGSVLVFFPTLAAALAGGWWFTALIFAVALAAAWETAGLLKLANLNPSRTVLLACFVAGFAWVRLGTQAWLMPGVALLLMASLAWQLTRGSQVPISDWAVSVASGLYLGWGMAHLALLGTLAHSFWWIFITIGGTWMADSCAYFVGKRWGRHKLAPAISPKKTWEGYIGGIVGGAALGALVGALTPLGVTVSLLVSLAVSTLGTLGDLSESMFKRQAGAKDSGNLIPGMGGAFDRIDSLLWAGVVAYYLSVALA